jgi:hypothetical protein
MKNKITDLRNHLFEQLERLNNGDLSGEELKVEIERATAMSEIGKVIVDSAKVQVLAMKIVGTQHNLKTITEDAKEFTEAEGEPLKRPPAVYSNTTQDEVIKKYVPEGSLELTGE